jgi:hypothetical protein
LPRAWIAPNDPWLFERPGGGWHEGYLYDEMTEVGFELFPPNDPDPFEDLHSTIVFDQDCDLTASSRAAGAIKYYTVGLVSSNTGNETDESDLLASTAKAWKYAFGWYGVAMPDTALDSAATYSMAYAANGSHEGGLGGGCCGCIVTEVSDPDDKFSVTGGGCEGTIEFAGGDKCDAPYTATFQVTDLCSQYSDIIEVTVDVGGTCSCICENQCDYDPPGAPDGFLTAVDLGYMIDALFSGYPEPKDETCPTSYGDFDCDGFPTAVDLGFFIDHLFSGAPGPCDPCATP